MGTFSSELTFGQYAYGTMSESPGISYKTLQLGGGGGGGGSALTLDFTSGTLDPRIDFVRSTTGTYVNSSGVRATAASNTPRFDYDPLTLLPRGLLLEAAAINVATYSDDLTQAVWSKTNAVAPGGGLIAASIGVAGNHAWGRSDTITSGVSWTVSFEYKGTAGVRYLWFRGAAGLAASIVVDTLTNTIVSGSGTLTPSTDGYYRLSVSAVSTGTSAAFTCYLNPTSSAAAAESYTGGVTHYVHIRSYQLELGTYASSYIPTTTTSVNRDADQATMTGANFTNWFNASEGTFVIEADAGDPSSSVYIFTAGTGTAGSPHGLVSSGTTGGFNIWGGFSLNKTVTSFGRNAFKYAGAYANGAGGSVTVNGAAPATTATASVVAANSILYFGSYPGTFSGMLSGHIKTFNYYPSRLPDAQLQSLTT